MLKRLFTRLTFSQQSGFTLIELLVVLGILGILAIALLAAINPVEQLNKAQDTSLENIATTFVNANVQYYSTNNSFPAGCAGGAGGIATTLDQLSATCTQTLETANELKSSFSNFQTATLQKVTVVNPANSSTIYACFVPSSTTVKSNSNTQYTVSVSSKTVASGCTGAGCYWCAQ